MKKIKDLSKRQTLEMAIDFVKAQSAFIAQEDLDEEFEAFLLDHESDYGIGISRDGRFEYEPRRESDRRHDR
jgi:hypothetical protein